MKWVDAAGDGARLNLRTDSQDSWVFQPPMSGYVVDHSDFLMGAPRCDNRLARLLHDAGYAVLNPAFALQSIEVQSTVRSDVGPSGAIYGMKRAVFGPVRDVPLSDMFNFEGLVPQGYTM
jgi:hypothetical protein